MATTISFTISDAKAASFAGIVRDRLPEAQQGGTDAEVCHDWVVMVATQEIAAAEIDAAKAAVDAATTDADRKDALFALYNLQHP